MSELEDDLLKQIKMEMQRSGKTQADFANSKGVTRQAAYPYFNGRKSLLTNTGREILEYLGLRIRLERVNPDDRE